MVQRYAILIEHQHVIVTAESGKEAALRAEHEDDWSTLDVQEDGIRWTEAALVANDNGSEDVYYRYEQEIRINEDEVYLLTHPKGWRHS